MSWWGYLNFYVIQWFFVRIEREEEDDDDGTVVTVNIIGPILPLSGWWQGYIPQRYKHIKVWSRK